MISAFPGCPPSPVIPSLLLLMGGHRGTVNVNGGANVKRGGHGARRGTHAKHDGIYFPRGSLSDLVVKAKPQWRGSMVLNEATQVPDRKVGR